MAGPSDIVSLGFGSWGSVADVVTLGFGVGEESTFTPVLHYHTLEGPSRRLHPLVGPAACYYMLEGPSRKLKTLTGSQ